MHRRSTLDQRFELLAAQPTAWGIPVAAVRDQAVLMDPVADRGWIAADERTNLRQRETLLQRTLQEIPIHGQIMAGGPDGKRTYVPNERGFTKP